MHLNGGYTEPTLTINGDAEMYRITVTKNEVVKAVYFNSNVEAGSRIAKAEHPKCTLVAERWDELFDDYVEVVA